MGGGGGGGGPHSQPVLHSIQFNSIQFNSIRYLFHFRIKQYNSFGFYDTKQNNPLFIHKNENEIKDNFNKASGLVGKFPYRK